MSNNEISSRVENDKVLILERIFDAPREIVFNMFKDPEHLKHWWGPSGWELPVCRIDIQPGGIWHFCMKCMDQNQGESYGMESWGKVVYKPKKLLSRRRSFTPIISRMPKAISTKICQPPRYVGIHRPEWQDETREPN